MARTRDGCTASSYVEIAPGVPMPVVGFGTWRLAGPELVRVLGQAVATGYRLVDTASYYENEAAVGAAIRSASEPRDALFVTTKIRGSDQGRQRASRGLEMSLRRLRLDYVDLVLIHWPLPMRNLYLSTWEELIALRARGLARAVGVSNFDPGHIDQLVQATGVAPAVNQIQCNPAVQNAAMRSYNAAGGVHSQAWEPLGTRSDVLSHPSVVHVAEQLGKSPAQVVLRWHLHHGNSVVPKTATPARLQENLGVFGWDLPPELLRALDALDQGARGRVDPEINLVD